LALAWAAEFDTQPKALLLAALPFEFLNAMHTSGLEIDGERTRALLGELYEKIRENDLEIEDLLPIQAPNDTSVSAIRAAFRRAIASALRRKRADEAGPRRERRILEAKLAPFQDKIKTIYDNFARIRTPRRYPGGGPLPPAGLSQVRRFVEEFVSSNGCMPSGVHTIPEGPDVFSARSKAFDLDFDAMRLDLPFLLRSDWDANAGRARWFWKDPKTPAVSNVFESEAAAIAAWKDGKVVLHEPT
jgi:hypothetical protein